MKTKKLLAIVLAVVMAIVAVPAVVFAADGPELQVEGLPDTVKAGQQYEFTVGAVNCGDSTGTMVKGTFTYDTSMVEKLEYLETDPNADPGWHEFTGNEFGPAETGFPLMDGLKSTFRVTFKGEGEFKMNINIVEFANPGNVLITADKTLTVEPIVNPTVTVDLANEIKAGQPTEFTVSTTGGDATGTMVKAVFSYDADKVEKLEYYETDPQYEGWKELVGTEFGPTDTGFPLMDLASKFRVTFKGEGSCDITVNIVEFANPQNVLATTSKTITVAPIVNPSVEVVNMPSEVKTGTEVYFDVTTHAGDFANTMVKALFNYDKSKIEKLEYQESTDGQWYDLTPYDSFGPEGGYPLTEGATSHFRVTFAEACEDYSFNIQVVAVNGGAVLAESTTTIQVKDPVAPTVTVNLPVTEVKTGEPMEFTVSTTQGDTPDNTMVKGVFTYDASKVEKLEYYETAGDAGWMELKGNEFGPAGTGFPLMDLTSRFRVTFKEAVDDYSFAVQIVAIDGGAVLAQTTASIDVVPSHTHTAQYVAAEDATCTDDGNTAYWYCTGCGKYFSDEALTVEIEPEATVIAKLGHNAVKTEPKDATCTEDGNIAYWYCDQCGKYFSDEALTVEIEPEAIVITKLGHNAVKTEPKDATCTEDGNIAYWYCDQCGKYFSDEALTVEIEPEATVITKLGHNAVKVEAKEPTATEDGNTAYWYCEQCGKYFSDEALTVEIALEDTILPATGETETPTEPETPTGEDGTQTPADEQPDTGDSALPMFAGLAAVSGLALLALRRRRK